VHDKQHYGQNDFKVGRSVDTDMRIADISVSRVHSFIRVCADELILQDNGSKFGTLIKLARPTELLCANRFLGDTAMKLGLDNPASDNMQSTIIQIGKTMIWFKMFD
jgi:hypothetical protein